jgi:hypothetical protein
VEQVEAQNRQRVVLGDVCQVEGVKLPVVCCGQNLLHLQIEQRDVSGSVLQLSCWLHKQALCVLQDKDTGETPAAQNMSICTGGMLASEVPLVGCAGLG